MSKNNHIDYIEFPVANAADVLSAKAFFSDAFGWEYKTWADEYIDTQDSGVTSGVSVDAPAAKPLAVIYADDIEVTYDSVVRAGGKITRDIFELPGGRRFHFTEPSGNELAVWTKTGAH